MHFISIRCMRNSSGSYNLYFKWFSIVGNIVGVFVYCKKYVNIFSDAINELVV